MAEQKKTQSTQKKTSQNTRRKSTTSSAGSTKKTPQSRAKQVAQEAKTKKRVRFGQYLMDSTPLFFGFYMALVSGLVGAGKYYMQSTLANDIFTTNSQDLIAYWVALSDLGFLAGLAGLIVVPAISYYQRHGLHRLGIAFVVAFVLVLVAVGILWYYIESLPAPEPTPRFPQGLQQ